MLRPCLSFMLKVDVVLFAPPAVVVLEDASDELRTDVLCVAWAHDSKEFEGLDDSPVEVDCDPVWGIPNCIHVLSGSRFSWPTGWQGTMTPGAHEPV